MEDDNLNELAEYIFSRPPQMPNAIQLQMDDSTYDLANVNGIDNTIFEILCVLTMKGIRKLYGDIKIIDLSREQFEVISEYVKSYGYILRVYVNNTFMSPWEYVEPIYQYRISFDKYTL
jgi:hypothetical protein